jgi:hypothetical protein
MIEQYYNIIYYCVFKKCVKYIRTDFFIIQYTIKHANVVTSIKQSPVLKGYLCLFMP